MEVRDYDYGDEEDHDEDGGDGGGFPPLPFESFSLSFLSLSSKRILTHSFNSYKALFYASSYEIPLISKKPDIMAMDSSSTSGETCTSSILI